jgi:predicted DsbA family dithiol-disulfide isomerase
VEASRAEAARLGIRGVPFYVFNGDLGISGAQPVETFVAALDEASA